MLKDGHGNELFEGCEVRILNVDPNWFDYLPKDSCKILQEACQNPVKIEYLDEDDGTVSLILPATIAEDGEYVGNSLSVNAFEVEVV